jgi:hypothetical protein
MERAKKISLEHIWILDNDEEKNLILGVTFFRTPASPYGLAPRTLLVNQHQLEDPFY